MVAYDPFLTPERALELGVEKVELDELLARADFITLHTPLTDQTRNILSRENLAKTKQGVRIVNCARGGLIDEAALKDALESGHVAGAALDVFVEEPATANPLFGAPGLVATPHLGASTTEAQVNVAIQVAEQMSDFLVRGGVTNALNMPSLSAEEAPRLRPYMELAEKLGSLVGQVEGAGSPASRSRSRAPPPQLNQKPITGAVLAGLMRVYSDTREHGQRAVPGQGARARRARDPPRPRGRLSHAGRGSTVDTPDGPRSVAGTLFGNAAPRLVDMFGIAIEAELDGEMIYIVNEDAPGFIGRLGTALGEAGVNIATFHLGRREAGGEAVALVSVDGDVPAQDGR